jgi:hypothetical protein
VWHPPKYESSWLAGRIIWIGRAIKYFKLKNVELLSNLQGFQRELNRINRPKLYRCWSKYKGFTHVLTGICTEKIFWPLI